MAMILMMIPVPGGVSASSEARLPSSISGSLGSRVQSRANAARLKVELNQHDAVFLAVSLPGLGGIVRPRGVFGGSLADSSVPISLFFI